MYNSKGMPTNGIQGFVRHIFTAIKDIKPSHVAICWDMGKRPLEMLCILLINKIDLRHQKN